MEGKVLIIDGNVNFLYGLETKLVVSGTDTITCDGTGYVNDIIHTIRQEKINFIIADLELPDFNGLDVLERIKSESDFSQIPFFVYTFLNDESIKIKAQNLGAMYYFLKDDIGMDEFLIKLQKILSNQNKIKNFKYEN
jgi:DNA-binding NarL/FixJ family response regulator